MRLSLDIEKRFYSTVCLSATTARYPFRTGYKYDPDSLLRRAAARAGELLLLPGAAQAHRFLKSAARTGWSAHSCTMPASTR